MAARKISDRLPPLPQSLKAVSAYVQRAEELKAKDPIMAYWCTYYAAQLGLDQKSHETGARDYLYALISVLEDMKKELGSNDAVEHEAAGAAYVENFALKVFTLADNEDRKGEASRSTAKKFVAAANFLELLRVFEKSNYAEVNDEKVRYAKWKATEISRAFREGRKPTPGDANHDMKGFSEIGADTPTSRNLADLSPGGTSLFMSPETNAPTIPSRTPPSKSKQLPSNIDVTPRDAISPGTWSTVATPGSEAVGPSSSNARMAFASAMNRWNRQVEADDQNNIDGPTRGGSNSDLSSRKVRFTPSVVGGLSSTDGSPPPSPDYKPNDPMNPGAFSNYSQTSPPQNRAGAGPSSLGRFDPTTAPLPESSPSGSSLTSLEGSPPHVTGKPVGRPRSGSLPPAGSMTKPGGSPTGPGGAKRSSPPGSKRLSLQPTAPPPPPPAPSSAYLTGRERRASVSGRPSPPQNNNPSPYSAYQSPQLPNNGSFTSTSTLTSPTPPGYGRPQGSPNRGPVSGLPPVDYNPTVPTPYRTNIAPKPPSPPSRYSVPAPEPSPSVELTPSLIAKAQKHCRYAISALEYEDPEQARKELRAALAVLGER